MNTPTEAECWSGFWQKVAAIYATLDHEQEQEVQQLAA